jgi:DNA-binding transcriptional ArsR family regulator
MVDVRIDRDLLKAIGADTRIEILKILSKGRQTPSRLAQLLNLSVPTIIEHVAKLEDAGLVLRIDEGRKWKYYALTDKGESIMITRPDIPIRAFIILGMGLLLLFSPLFFSNYSIGEEGQAYSVEESSILDADQSQLMMATSANETNLKREIPPQDYSGLIPYVQGFGIAVLLVGLFKFIKELMYKNKL